MSNKYYKIAYFILLLLFLLLFVVIIKGYKEGHIKFETKYLSYDYKHIETLSGDLMVGPTYDVKWYIDELSKVEDSIQMYTYSFIYDEVIDKFKQLAKNGVDVTIIIENNKYKNDDKDYYDLKKEFSSYDNITVLNDNKMGTNFVHAKTLLLDENRYIIQTANITYSAFFRSREFFYVGESENIYDSLKYLFKQDKNGKQIEQNKLHDNLWICSINCRNNLNKFLSNAEKSIKIYTQSLNDKNIINILKEKKDEIDLNMIVSKSSGKDFLKSNFSEEELQILNKPYLHAKSILVDGKYLIIGSMNLTSNSIENNREINIVLKNKQIITKFKELFKKDWNRMYY